MKYGKNTSKSEQLNFAISYSRVFGKHDVSATAVVERAESEGDELLQMYGGIGMSYGGTSATAGTLITDAEGTHYKNMKVALSLILVEQAINMITVIWHSLYSVQTHLQNLLLKLLGILSYRISRLGSI